MFFKKKRQEKPWGVPWDEKTLEHIINSYQFPIQITNASKKVGFGGAVNFDPTKCEPDFEFNGLMDHPKFIPVEVRFAAAGIPDLQDQDPPTGFWSYSHRDHHSDDGEIKIPLLEFYLDDQDQKIREALFEAHKAALWSGRRSSFARFFKRKGDGVMSPKDQERQWSEDQHPLLRVITYAELQSERLPSWAYPHDDQRFSIKSMPPWYDLKL
jgi:hypothetical protein